MHLNSKHNTSELEEYIHLYLKEHISYRELSESYGLLLTSDTFSRKVLRYKEHGVEGLQPKRRKTHYSSEFKKKLIFEHLHDNIPMRKLARKYNLPGHGTVRNWIIKYTEGKGDQNRSPKSEVYIMKGRKTTQQEKIEIVKDYLKNQLSYKEAAEKHQVSYNNVYSWVQKYKEHGPEGLVDGRGRGKSETIQTPEEKLKAEMSVLKARNEYLEAENVVLKKLDEVERELSLRKQDTKWNTKRSRKWKKKD